MHNGTVDVAGSGIDPTWYVDGKDDALCVVGQRGKACRWLAQRAVATDAEHAVDDEVCFADELRVDLCAGVPRATTGLEESRQSRGRLGFTEQQGMHACAAGSKARTGVQRVAAVVALADEEYDARAVDPTEQARPAARERHRCALHERTFGQLRHEGCFRLADRVDVVDGSHVVSL